MNNEYKKVKFGEIGRFERGKSKHRPRDDKKLFGGIYPFIQTGDIKKSGYVVREYSESYSDFGLKQSRLWAKGTLCITIAANIADSAILGINACFPDSVVGFESNEHSTNLYVHYLLKSLKEKMNQDAIGSVQKNINLEYLRNFEISLPPLAEQKRIAEILSSLDDKIELNERMNKNLEEQAQALFKHWFVDFEFSDDEGKPYKSNGGDLVESELGLIPRGWRVGTLGEEFDITMGQSPKGESYNEIGDGMVFYQGRTDFKNRFPERRLFTNDPKRMAKKFDVLMSVRAPVGDVNVANEVCCIGRGLASISSEYQSYCLYKILSLKSSFDIFNGDGTVFGSITRSSFENIKIIVPKSEIILKFECNIKKIDKMIYNLSQEIQNLKSLRDTLLPRLMSGEV